VLLLHEPSIRSKASSVGGGPRDQTAITITDPEVENACVNRCKAWQRTKYDGGWGAITWPAEYGGRGLSGIHDGIFKEEEAKRVSATGVFAVGIGMTGPTIIAHGTASQKERFLPAMLKGEVVWCQLFSESVAGSFLIPALGCLFGVHDPGGQKVGDAKRPMRIVMRSGVPFAFAGLWSVWTDPAGNRIPSRTIITTAANEVLKPIHHRMPVILPKRRRASGWTPTSTTATRWPNFSSRPPPTLWKPMRYPAW